MRNYVVQPGDSPAKIAIQFAGCPRCTIDLIRANAHKPAVRHPNGFLSFQDLSVGEKLVLPDKWFSKEFDELPPSYFAALPHPDGVTLHKTQQTGVVGGEAPSQQKEGPSTGAIIGMSLLGIGVVGGAIYWVTGPSYPKRRRVRRVNYDDDRQAS